jgi:hypothetical protein
VSWQYAGKEVWVRPREGRIEVRYGRERIAVHERVLHRHAVVRNAEHHREIPLGVRTPAKVLVHVSETAPVADVRPLAARREVRADANRR